MSNILRLVTKLDNKIEEIKEIKKELCKEMLASGYNVSDFWKTINDYRVKVWDELNKPEINKIV